VPDKIIREIVSHPPRLGLSIDLPLVSFLMPTYGRVAQEYPQTELLILNDNPGQTVTIDPDKYPGVRVFNWPYRMSSLGAKMNLLVLEAAGTVCCQCDDDDVSLPWRAAAAVAALGKYDYWTPGVWWYCNYHAKTFVADSKSPAVGHAWGAYRRSAMLNRFPDVTHAMDAIVHQWALKNLRVGPERPTDPKFANVVYRWGNSDYHLSGHPDMDKAFAEAPPGAPGVYEIKPRMFTDWAAEHDRVAGGHPSFAAGEV
jgi:glycosyltransferase involved in cell wall biosynthesis